MRNKKPGTTAVITEALPVKGLPGGSYELNVRVEDIATGRKVASTKKFMLIYAFDQLTPTMTNPDSLTVDDAKLMEQVIRYITSKEEKDTYSQLNLDGKKAWLKAFWDRKNPNPGMTGSVGVVTINMPRIGYLAKNKKEFFKKLDALMEIAKESLETKRKLIENLTEKGLYPYTKFYLEAIKMRRGDYWANHFSTIGLVGMNEALINLIGKDITTKEGQKLAEEILVHMRERIISYQKETGDLFNLEATPAEGTSYRLARIDQKKYPDMIFANGSAVKNQKAEPYYTNSSQLPVNFTEDIFEALDLQDRLQTKYTGGTVLHGFLGERINDIETTKQLVKKVAENYSLPYFTLTPTFSVCPVHGYLSGEHEFCPKCVVKQKTEIYSRVVGYIRPVDQWNNGKRAEYTDRKEFVVEKA